MSENEKRQRQEYKRVRKKWILIQAIVLVLVAVLTLSMSLPYYFINRTKYVDYTEKSGINYLVKLAANEFYEQEQLEKDRSYVTALVETVDAEFDYELNMSAFANVVFSYSYTIDANLLITDKYTGTLIYDTKTELVPALYYTQNGASRLAIHEAVSVNFREFNNKAMRFIKAYDLKDVNAQLAITMKVDTKSDCVAFENKSTNSYFTTVSFPLTLETSEPATTSSVVDGDVRTLACKSGTGSVVFLVLAIIFGVLTLLLGGFFLFFVLKTKNHDINYTNKVKRLVASYRSFIQEILDPFPMDGYKQVLVKTFDEMLDVRDTIGSPLLMHANEDGTATKFMIPTSTGLVYVYEIRVENYDEIYGTSDSDRKASNRTSQEESDLCERIEMRWQKIKGFFVSNSAKRRAASERKKAVSAAKKKAAEAIKKASKARKQTAAENKDARKQELAENKAKAAEARKKASEAKKRAAAAIKKAAAEKKKSRKNDQ